MPLLVPMLWGGRPLIRNGVPALGPACCCGDVPRIPTNCCDNDIPATLYLHITGDVNAVVTLTHTDVGIHAKRWYGTMTCPGHPDGVETFEFYCEGDYPPYTSVKWNLNSSGVCAVDFQWPPVSCDPFLWDSGFTFPWNCCGVIGSVQFSVNE